MRWFVNHRHESTIERHSLSHARWACQLPQRGSRGTSPTMPITRPLTKHQRAGDFLGSVWGYVLPFNRVLAKPWGYGRFSSPLRNSEVGTFYHSTKDTPSVSLRSTAPSEREPGTPSSGRVPFIVPPRNRDVSGDFHRPYEGSEIFTFYHQGGWPFGGSRLVFGRTWLCLLLW